MRGTIEAATLRQIANEACAAFSGGGCQVPSFSARYPSLTLDDAYRVTALANDLRIAQGHKPVGRKIGFTNSRLWDEYGVRAPIWGYVYDRTLHNLAAPLPLAPFAEPKIEPEIMLGLAKAPSPGMDDAALLSCVAWVAHGFEIVQSIYPGWKFTPADSVAAQIRLKQLFFMLLFYDSRYSQQLGQQTVWDSGYLSAFPVR